MSEEAFGNASRDCSDAAGDDETRGDLAIGRCRLGGV
jgi:hypothetical protein